MMGGNVSRGMPVGLGRLPARALLLLLFAGFAGWASFSPTSPVQHPAGKLRVVIECRSVSGAFEWADTVHVDSLGIGATGRVGDELRVARVYQLQWTGGVLIRHCDRLTTDTLR